MNLKSTLAAAALTFSGACASAPEAQQRARFEINYSDFDPAPVDPAVCQSGFEAATQKFYDAHQLITQGQCRAALAKVFEGREIVIHLPTKCFDVSSNPSLAIFQQVKDEVLSNLACCKQIADEPM